MNVCSIWPLAQISDDFYYLDIWQRASERFLRTNEKEQKWGVSNRNGVFHTETGCFTQKRGVSHRNGVCHTETGCFTQKRGVDCHKHGLRQLYPFTIQVKCKLKAKKCRV